MDQWFKTIQNGCMEPSKNNIESAGQYREPKTTPINQVLEEQSQAVESLYNLAQRLAERLRTISTVNDCKEPKGDPLTAQKSEIEQRISDNTTKVYLVGNILQTAMDELRI